MSFTLWLDKFLDQPANEVLQAANQAQKIRLDDLRVFDLLFDGAEPIYFGVYLFYSAGGECLRVGKNSSQTFVQRLPWHLSVWEHSWMNYLLTDIQKDEQIHSLRDAAEIARNHSLLLFHVHRLQGTTISRLEKFFRVFAVPKYNAYRESYRKRYAGVDLRAPLTDVLNRL